MAGLITHTGILEIQQNIAMKEGTLKARLLDAIVSYFPDDDSLLNTAAIPPDELVKKVWETEDPAEIKIKRKNLSSLKSSLNKSLKQLDKEGKNPQGIILGRDNVFIISDERKNDLLRQMGLAGEAPKTVQEMLQAFKTIFSDILKEQGLDGVNDLLKELDETKKTVRSLAGLPPEKEPEAAGPGETEKDAAVPGEPAAGEAQGQGPLPKTGTGAAGELEEVVEEEALPEEIAETEEIAAEELVEEELLEEEILEVDGAEEIEEIEEIEELPAAATETLPQAEPEDFLEESGPTEIIELAEGEGPDEVDAEEALPGEIQETEEIAAEELVEEELLGDEIQEVDGAEEIEEIEELPAAATETLPQAEPEDLLEESGPTEIIELAEGEELEEVDEEEALPGEIQETEEIAEEELVEEELLEEEIETLPEAQMEEAEGDETIELAEGEELEEIDAEAPRQPTPLDILSKYLEATEALSQGADLLKESGEEYTAQLLDRFMPKFIKIPEGTYPVGSNTPKTLEQPQKIIRIKGFYLGQFPVTNDLFEFFVRETGYVSSAEAAGYGTVFEGRCSRKIDPHTGRESMTLTSGTTARQVTGANWRHPAGPDSSLEGKHNHPVVQVSHDDAMAFAAWAGKRLPSEEEWEAAARGTDGRLFPWGNLWLATLGNFEAACLGDTTAVDHHGPQSASPFGIYDLLGNVLEWTSTPYSQKTSGDPIYILKGGCWTSGGVITTSARRIETRKYWSNTIGFRCAVSESKRRRQP